MPLFDRFKKKHSRAPSSTSSTAPSWVSSSTSSSHEQVQTRPPARLSKSPPPRAVHTFPVHPSPPPEAPPPVQLPIHSRPLPPVQLPIHSRPPPPPPPRDDRNGRMIEPEDLRDLLESIRERYKLDREIWGLRDVNVANRGLVKQRMQRADAMLDHIQRTVISFDNRIYFESDEDYRAFLDIKARVMDRSKRVWGNRGPWLDSD